jgi:hypothetical protein
MATKTEIAATVAFVFTAYGREANEMHLEAWYMVLGQYPQAEIAGAARSVVESSENLPPVGAIVRAIKDRRITATKNMTTTTQHSLRIASAVKDYRKANPGCTADDVAEYVSRLERALVR